MKNPPVDEVARSRFAEAYRAYGAAARSLNEAAGAMLFEGVDAPL